MKLIILSILIVGSLFGQAMFRAQNGSIRASAKARTFNGTSGNVQSAATVDLSSTKRISLGFWLYWDDFSTGGDPALMETSASYGLVAGAFSIFPNEGQVQFRIQTDSVLTSTSALLCDFDQPSGAAWHQYVLTIDITTAGAGTCTVYIDGVAASGLTPVNQATETNPNFGNLTLNVMSRNAASLFGAGRISEIAIWKSILSSGNAASLTACAASSSIDAANLLFYWPIKQVSPETPNAGAVNLTVNGTTNSASNCP